MITKLKYVGVSREDLLGVYTLFIRSLTEYCSIVWQPSLTMELSWMLERIKKTCLKVILGDDYTGYEAALDITKLQTLHQRREEKCLRFAKKCS